MISHLFWHTYEISLLTAVFPALISYIRPVFVFRSDQDSRRKTVEEIKRRTRSGGEWPQVTLTIVIIHENAQNNHIDTACELGFLVTDSLHRSRTI